VYIHTYPAERARGELKFGEKTRIEVRK